MCELSPLAVGLRLAYTSSLPSGDLRIVMKTGVKARYIEYTAIVGFLGTYGQLIDHSRTDCRCRGCTWYLDLLSWIYRIGCGIILTNGCKAYLPLGLLGLRGDDRRRNKREKGSKKENTSKQQRDSNPFYRERRNRCFQWL